MNRKGAFWGVLLIVIGCLLIINQTFDINFFSMTNFWPLFILIPGLMFEFSYFISRKNPGVLVPGGILTTIGLLFFFEILTDWTLAEYTWPVYILAVAIGLFQLYLFSGRPSGLLIPVFILTAVASISFLGMIFGNVLAWIDFGLVGPVIFILLGLYILFRATSKK
jgi:hypothetical protein